MLPHERSLVARMEGRPFALLGVNCDDEMETVQQVSCRQQLNWRNWCFYFFLTVRLCQN